MCFFFQAEDGIRDLVRSRGLGDVYKRQVLYRATNSTGPWSVQQTELPATGVYSDTAVNGVTLSLIHI